MFSCQQERIWFVDENFVHKPGALIKNITARIPVIYPLEVL